MAARRLNQIRQIQIRSLCTSAIFFSLILMGGLLLSACDLIDPVLPAVEPPQPTATPLPTATADPSGNFIAFLSTDFGVALRHPPNWIVNEGELLKVASTADLLTRTRLDESGALLEISFAPEFLIETDNLADPLRDYVIDSGDYKVIEETDNVLLGGQPAAMVTALINDETGQEVTTVFALIKNNKAGILAVGKTAAPETNEALLRGMIGSLIVSLPEPTPSPPTLTPRPPGSAGTDLSGEGEDGQQAQTGAMGVPAGLLQFQASNGEFSLGYPSNWLVRDDGDAIIFASSEELLADNKFETGATILIFPQTLATPDEPDPVQVLEDFIAQFAIYDALELVVPPRPVTLAGQPAATAQYDVVFQRYPLLVDYYVVVNGQRVVILVNLITSSEVGSLKPITDGIASSITVNP